MKNTKTSKFSGIRFAVILFLFAAGLLLWQGASAIEYGLLGGKPAYPNANIKNSGSWFIYDLAPGEAKEDGVQVMNLFNEPWTALIYAADNTKSSSGGFALEQFSEPKNQVGSWVRFYPDDPPEDFRQIFENKERKILSFCELDREKLTEEMVELDQLEEDEDISDDKFQEFETWCQGVESIERVMESKEIIVIPFVFRVPEEVDAGEHTGGILIQKVAKEDATTAEGSAVKLTTRVGVRIYQTVPGEIVRNLFLEDFNVNKNFREFDLSRFFFAKWFGKGNPKPEEYIVQSKIRNKGNVSVGHDDVIRVEDIIFKKRTEEISREFQVLKDDSFISNYAWNNPRFGRFAFSKEIRYEDSEDNVQTIKTGVIKIWILPWREILVVAIIIIILTTAYILWRRYHKKKYGGVGWVEYEVKEGDDINTLAEKFGISWDVLAKTNKIKAPFKLEVGQAILVPFFDDLTDATKVDRETVEGSEVKEDKPEEKIESYMAADTEGDLKESVMKDIKEDVEAIEESVEEVEEEDIDEDVDEDENMPKKKPSKLKKVMYIIVGIVIVGLVAAGTVWVLKKNNSSSGTIKIEDKISIESMAVTEEVNENQEQESSQEVEEVEENQSEEEESDDVSDESQDENESDGTADTNEETDTNNESEAVEEESSTNEEAINSVEVAVLNRGAAAGSAGKMKDFLEENNYEKVEAGNADDKVEPSTIIYYQEGFKEQAENLKKVLESQYGDIEVRKGSSEEETSSNVVVILDK